MSNDNEKDKATHARAKNQTVMLTPEITGQVRAMLQQSEDSSWEKVEQAKPSAAPNYPAAEEPHSPQPEPEYQEPVVPPRREPVSYQAEEVSSGEGMYLATTGKKGKLIGFLICYDKQDEGQMVEIRSGRWLVSNAPSAHGNTIVVEDDTVSSLHAIFRVGEDGTCQVMDQLAEFGTVVVRYDSGEEDEIVGATTTVEHGDVVRFGEMSFTVVLIPQSDD